MKTEQYEEVRRLAAGVAHDLNNVLTVVNGYADLLSARVGAGDPLSRSIIQIRDAGARAANISRLLLAVGRRQVLTAEPTDVNEHILGCLEHLRQTAGAGIDISVIPGAEIPTALADPHLLQQCLSGLIASARGGMAGSGAITIKTALFLLESSDAEFFPELLGREFVRITLAENGAVINPEMMPHIFEPYRRSGDYPGAGLELAAVRATIEEMNGCVRVEASPGGGNTFHLYLPTAV